MTSTNSNPINRAQRALPILLLAVCALFTSCAPQTLTLSTPPVWKSVPKPSAPRWVVAYPSSHSSALTALKQHRSAQGYEVVSLPAASREQIAQTASSLNLGRHEGDCLLLIGSAPSAVAKHHKMAGRASDNHYALDSETTTPLFAAGRLPSTSPTGTRQLVSRILAYEKTNHPRDSKLLVGNPMGGGNRMRTADMLITSLSKKLTARMDSSWDVSGAADVTGHPLGLDSEAFHEKFWESLEEPYVVGTYFGHSDDKGLCYGKEGTVFGAGNWPDLEPSTSHGLFLSCGCYTAKHSQAVAQQAVRSPGGPIAFIGATGESYAAIGYLAAKGLTNAMDATPPATVGEWWMEVQRGIATEPMSGLLFKIFDSTDGGNGEYPLIEQRRFHLEMWMLLGDPATRLL